MSAALEIDILRQKNSGLSTKNSDLIAKNGKLTAENRELTKKLEALPGFVWMRGLEVAA